MVFVKLICIFMFYGGGRYVAKKQKTFLQVVALADDDQSVWVLDQRKLPLKEEIIALTATEQVAEAIKTLAVRGAPAIGICAAYGLYLASRSIDDEDFWPKLAKQADILAASRPTAVNLRWALNRMLAVQEQAQTNKAAACRSLLRAEALAIDEEEKAKCRLIGENGLRALGAKRRFLTHCNAGALATGAYGTALAPIYRAAELGLKPVVFADETRPLLQGARLTCYELTRADIDTTLICDSMAASVLAAGKVEAVLVGCDRVAKNGDTANKIGTLSVAVNARYCGVPFYVCAPFSSIDINCPSGTDIPIEQRAGSEITSLWYKKPQAPAQVKVYNPAFDVTPSALVTAFITERGVFSPNQLRELLARGGV